MKEVLIVDDEESILFIHERIFSFIGCRVTKAFDGNEAVEIAQGNYFDLILLDLNMPKMDGIDTLKSIRECGLSKTSPIVIVSAYGDPININEAYLAGANDFIKKPFDVEEIILKTENWISTHYSE